MGTGEFNAGGYPGNEPAQISLSRGRINTPSHLIHSAESRRKHQPDGPLGLYVDFLFTYM